MHARIRNRAASPAPLTTLAAPLLALAALLAPGAGHAADEAPGASPATAGPATLPLAALPKPAALDLSSLKSIKPAKAAEDDAFREKDVWGRIRSGYAIPDLSNELVAKHTKWYAARPDHMAITTGRASRYLFHVVTELEKRGMWQFVPGTGRDFNLKQDAFKDERRGILASTDAALTYLQRLYDMFGDWQLALAAYNWGEGSVQRAIAKNQAAGKPTDFQSLAELMPTETREYVPKLQAVKNIIGNPTQFGVHLPLIDNTPYFTAVDKTSDIDLTIAAQLAELSVAEFKALNPQFKRPVITGDEQTKILLPKENAAKFALNLSQWGKELSTWTTHKITTARESIGALASRFHTTPEVIRQANGIPQRSMLKAGSTILVPRVSSSAYLDIAPEVADNATMAFEAERAVGKSSRSGYQRAAAGKPAKGGPVSLVKARVPRDAKGKNGRKTSN